MCIYCSCREPEFSSQNVGQLIDDYISTLGSRISDILFCLPWALQPHAQIHIHILSSWGMLNPEAQASPIRLEPEKVTIERTSVVEGQLWLHIEFDNILGYIRLKKAKVKIKNKLQRIWVLLICLYLVNQHCLVPDIWCFSNIFTL